ncbi:daptide-type RiPP biosynthesis aminotransferase [Microbacterium lacticum]|nr:daptide-type RiPP biosynthesis aminotransferase [Microbacterium lacticum]GEB96077.1 hypothetical protein MLA01_22960 [Microbacterium lacticum]GGI71702.1 hypothetical protein GCM10009724_23240 [Microbacterium lacticum]
MDLLSHPLEGLQSRVAGLVAECASTRALQRANERELGAQLAALAALQRLVEALLVDATGEVVRRSETAVRDERMTSHLGCRNVTELLEETTRVSTATAGRWQRAAKAVRPQVSDLTGELLASDFPSVRAAMVDGVIGVDGILAITGPLQETAPRVSTEARHAAADVVVAEARGEGPDGAPPACAAVLAIHAQTWSVALDQDGSEPRERAAVRKRSFVLGTATPHGVPARGMLLPEVAAQLQTIFDAQLAPAVQFDDPFALDENGEPLPLPAVDDRTRAQKQHDALAAALGVAASSGQLPTIGGHAPTLVVSVADDGRCVVSAHGTTVQMADGSRLVCGTSGLWNVNLGYGDPAIAAAIAEATTASSYAGVFRYENVYARRAAEDLIRLTDERFDTVVFTTSGGSANDAVLKIARQFWALRDMPHRKIVAGLEQSFHGLTYGAFGLTGEDLGRSLYGAETRLVRHIPANDVDALTALMSRAGGTIGALVVEPVLGTGNTVLTAEFVEALGAARDAHGVLLVVDEVATGFGRTGPLFASSEWPWAPDLLVTSKGLSNGTSAIAAILVAPRVARTFHDAGAVLVHAETQAGNAASCAAISATVQRFAELDALARGARLAARLDTAIDDLIATTPSITGVQGRGCFRALSLSLPDGSALPQAQVPDVVAALRTTGRVIVHPGLAGIQLAPALTMTDDALAALFAGIRIGLAAFAARTS